MAAVRLRREVRGRFRAGRGAAGTAGGGSGREGSGAAPEPGRAAGAPLEASHRGLRRRPGAPGSAADARCPPALHSRVPAVRPPRRCPSRPPPPFGAARLRASARWVWRWARGRRSVGRWPSRWLRALRPWRRCQPAVRGRDGSRWRAPARACLPRCGRWNASLPTRRPPPLPAASPLLSGAGGVLRARGLAEAQRFDGLPVKLHEEVLGEGEI